MALFFSSAYTGYKKADYATRHASYYNEVIQPLSPEILQALEQSPFASGDIPGLEKVSDLLLPAYQKIENGYTSNTDGSLRIACLTLMPGVTPAMWHWWFGWHGCSASRYKLWHPKAHVNAAWKDGNQSDETYIGRTSIIQEYIGSSLEKASIQFCAPEELGLKNELEKEVFICARIGYTHLPIDFGWLVHQIRKTENGSEMRSRFWVGGKHIQVRANGGAASLLSTVLQKIVKPSKQQAIELFTHCSEEMNHLAAFLPQLYNECHK